MVRLGIEIFGSGSLNFGLLGIWKGLTGEPSDGSSSEEKSIFGGALGFWVGLEGLEVDGLKMVEIDWL